MATCGSDDGVANDGILTGDRQLLIQQRQPASEEELRRLTGPVRCDRLPVTGVLPRHSTDLNHDQPSAFQPSARPLVTSLSSQRGVDLALGATATVKL
jgi:hypothetical protein